MGESTDLLLQFTDPYATRPPVLSTRVAASEKNGEEKTFPKTRNLMLKLPYAYTPADRILWDVVEEHLSEAAFEYGRWNAALRSPRYTLHELAEGPEEYLLAHLRGVMLAGKSGLERLVLPCLQLAAEQEPELLAIAAAMSLCFGHRDPIVLLLLDGKPAQRRALMGGLRLCDDSSLFDTWVVQTFQRGLMVARPRIALLDLAAERRLSLENLESSLLANDPQEAAVAVRAAQWSEQGRYRAIMEELILHPLREVRLPALTTALTWGSSRAFQCCLELTARRDPCARGLLDFVAVLGGPQEHELLLKLMDDDDPWLRYAAIRAIRLSGNARAVPPLIALLEAEDLIAAKLAGEAIRMIAGLAAADPQYHRDVPQLSEEEEERLALPDLADDDLDADLRPAEEADLPYLDAAAVAGWWSSVVADTDINHRMLLGRPLSSDMCLSMLREESMRSRRSIAYCVYIRSAGRHRIHVDRPSVQQLRELTALQRVPDLLSGNRLLKW